MVEARLPIAVAGPFLRGDEKTIDILKNENIIKIENVKEKRQMETEIAEVFMNPVRQRIIQ